MRHISAGTPVNYIAAPVTEGGKPSIKKVTVADARGDGTANLKLDENKFALSTYSATGEVGTFHFPDETQSVKAADTFGETAKPTPPAATPAASAK